MKNTDGSADDWHVQSLFYGIAFADIAVGRLQIVFRGRDIDTLDSVMVLMVEDIRIYHADVIWQPILRIEIVFP